MLFPPEQGLPATQIPSLKQNPPKKNKGSVKLPLLFGNSGQEGWTQSPLDWGRFDEENIAPDVFI